MNVPGNMSKNEFEAYVMDLDETKALMESKTPIKVIAVPGRLINIVVK